MVEEPAAWLEAGGCPGGPRDAALHLGSAGAGRGRSLPGGELAAPQAPPLGYRPGPSIQGPHSWAEVGAGRSGALAPPPHPARTCRRVGPFWGGGGGGGL